MNLRNYARIGRAFATRRVPVYAHFGITHRCDLTCKMCGIWRYGNKKEELSVEQIQQMAERMRRLGVVQVSIGGGEPFAYEELELAAKAFVDQGINLRVLTNAVNVPKERLDRMLEYGVRNFSISLDSLYPARFDYICEHEGSWEGAVRNMCYLSERLHGQGGLLVMNCVVSNLNLEECPDMVRFAKEIGFAVSFLPIELLPDPKAGVRNWEARFIRYRPEMGVAPGPQGDVGERVDRIYDTLIRMKREGWPILNSTPYLESSRTYLKTGRFPADGCDAGALYFSVSPNGQFTICHRTSHGYKHFLDPDFEDFFHSAEYEYKRQMEAGACEGCMRACWIDTSAMFRTVQGFFETARLNLVPARGTPVTFEEAMGWARYDDVPIVPGQGVAK
ncbi:MAG: radical SAM protein [Alphaproteobacteria bacterium]|nr:radical SAM protein [Alphaproteobacteria bacterium]